MNAIVQLINAAGRAFLDFALPMLIQSSVLILILLAVDLGLRRRVRAVFRYWIWMLVLVKLVLPPSLDSPVSLGTWLGDELTVSTTALFEPQEPTPAAARAPEPPPTAAHVLSPLVPASDLPPAPVASEVRQPPIAPADARHEEPAVEAMPPSPEVHEALPPAMSSAPALTWQGLAVLLWGAVVTALLLLLIQRAFFVRGLVGQSREADGSLSATLEECRARLRLRGPIALKLSPNASTPAVCGLLRPVILVPQNLAPRLQGQELRAVLLHELAHVKRGDLWVNLAQTLLQIIYFYNPLLWLANAMIRRTREQAVDETVLVALGETARQYPEILVNIAKLAFRRRPVLSLRLIGVVESRNALTARIRHMLSRPLPKTAGLGLLGLIVVVALAAVLLPMARAAQENFAVENNGPLDIQFIGVCPDGGKELYDANGKKLDVTLPPLGTGDGPWKADTLRRDFVLRVPEFDGQLLFLPFSPVCPAGTNMRLGGGFSLFDAAGGPATLAVSSTLDRTYHKAWARLIIRKLPVRKVDLKLQYFHGPRGEAVCTFTGPFTPGKTMQADEGRPYQLTPAAPRGTAPESHLYLEFHFTTSQPFTMDAPVLLYDRQGRRHLMQRGGGSSSPSGASLTYQTQRPVVSWEEVAAITIGERPHESTFRNIVVDYPRRPVRTYPAHLDQMAERLNLTGLSPEQLTRYEFKNAQEAIAVLDIIRGPYRMETAVRAIGWRQPQVDFAAPDTATRDKLRRVAARWLESPVLSVRAEGVQLGLIAGFREFLEPAFALLNYQHPTDAHQRREVCNRVLYSMGRYMDEVTAADIDRLIRLALDRNDGSLWSPVFDYCLRTSRRALVSDVLWELAQDDRPWLWWPSIMALQQRNDQRVRASSGLPEPMRSRVLLVSDMSRPGEAALTARGKALLPELLTLETVRMYPAAAWSYQRVIAKYLDRSEATAVYMRFLRELSQPGVLRRFEREYGSHHSLYNLMPDLIRNINLWYDVNLGQLGVYEPGQVNQEIFPPSPKVLVQLVAETLSWYEANEDQQPREAVFGGRVVDTSGEGIAGATLTLSRQMTFTDEMGRQSQRQVAVGGVPTDADGRFVFRDLANAEYDWLNVTATGFTARKHLSVSRLPDGRHWLSSGQGTDNVIIMEKPASLAGCVIGPDGRPLAKVVVRLQSYLTHANPGGDSPLTDEQGRFHTGPIMSGHHLAVVGGRERDAGPGDYDGGTAFQLVRIEEGQAVEDVVLDLRESTACLELEIVDANDEPVQGMRVSLEIDLPESPQKQATVLYSRDLPAQRVHRMENLPPLDGHLEVWANERYRQRVPIRLVPNQTRRCRVKFEQTAAELRPSVPPSRPRRERFEVTLPNGITVQLLGLRDARAADNAWWAPDGSPLPESVHTRKLGAYGPPGDAFRLEDTMEREIAYRLTGAADPNLSPTFELDLPGFPPGQAPVTNCRHSLIEREADAQIRSEHVVLPRQFDKAGIRIVFEVPDEDGLWKDRPRHTGASFMDIALRPGVKTFVHVGYLVPAPTRRLEPSELDKVQRYVSVVAAPLLQDGHYLLPKDGRLTLRDVIYAARYRPDQTNEALLEVIRQVDLGGTEARLIFNRNLGWLFQGRESDVPLEPGDAIVGGYIESTRDEEAPAKHQFGNVVTVTLTDEDKQRATFIDLDTGRLHTPPAGLDTRDSEALRAWMTAHSIDARFDSAPAVRGLLGLNMLALKVDDVFWYDAPADLRDRLLMKADSPTLLCGDDHPPATYLIKTDRYRMGILQILASDGMEIQYKLLENQNSGAGSPPLDRDAGGGVPAEPNTAAGKSADGSEKKPFSVYGMVTDQSGGPMPGVEVTAHCGVTTLMPTGRTVTDEAGRYTLYFTPGFLGRDVMLQAATIHARKVGFYEANLCRQGHLGMAGRMPSGEDRQSIAHYVGVVLPSQPHEVNFIMRPAARIEGELVDAHGMPLPGRTLVLTGDELYPSTSALAPIETDQNGAFVVERVPLESFWFEYGRRPPARSASIPFRVPGTWRIQLKCDESQGTAKLTIANQQPPAPAPGLLEFRIAPKQSELAAGVEERYAQMLAENRPAAGEDLAWFEVRPGVQLPPDVVSRQHEGKTWLLLWNEPSHAMLAGQDWGLKDVYETTDAMDRQSVGLTLDEKGTQLFHELTQANVNNSLAIILDGKVLSTPTIMSPIAAQCLIVGNFTAEEVRQIITVLKEGITKPRAASSLQAALFRVHGVVTDASGRPMAGVEVYVDCGFEKLRRADRTFTDANGRYVLEFKPAMYVADADPYGVGIQPAFVRAQKDGFYETSLRHKGNLVLAGRKPGPEEQRFVAGRAGVVLSHESYELNFTMAPAARLEGTLVDAQDKTLAACMIGLRSRRMYPPNVGFATVRTDGDGRFTIENVPCTSFQFSCFNTPLGQSGETAFPRPGTWRLNLKYRQTGQHTAELAVMDLQEPTTTTGPGPLGRHALSFDGVDDCLVVPPSPSMTLKPPFFIEVWAKPDFSALEPVYAMDSAAARKYWPYLSLVRKGNRLEPGEGVLDGGFQTFIRPTVSDPNGKCVGSLYAVGENGRLEQVSLFDADRLDVGRAGWYHIATDFQRERYQPSPDGPLVIGGNTLTTPQGFAFKGEIAEIRIWNKALTEAEVQWYRSSRLKGTEPNLVACWTFEEGAGQIVRDISRNGNHAQLGTTPEADAADPRWVSVDAEDTVSTVGGAGSVPPPDDVFIPPDANDAWALAPGVALDGIGQDVEGKAFISCVRDIEQTRNARYRFVLTAKDGRTLEPQYYTSLERAGGRLWEKFSFDRPYRRQQIECFRFEVRPGGDGSGPEVPSAWDEIHAVATERPAHAQEAPPGRYAIHFDGKDDYLFVPDAPSLWVKAPFFVEAWIQPEIEPTQNEPDQAFLAKGGYTRTGKVDVRGFGLRLARHKSDPTLLIVDQALGRDQGVTAAATGHEFTPGWMHVTGEFTFGDANDISAPGQPLVVGAFLIPTEKPFKGRLAELRIWDSSADRPSKAVPLAGSEPGLVACWTFEEGAGQIAYDLSPNANHARLGASVKTDAADPKWLDLRKDSTQAGREEGARGISGVVVDPDGRPLAGAQVALSTEDKGVTIRPPRLLPTELAGKTSAIVETDAQGRFSFPEAPREFVLVAAYETGFARADGSGFSSSRAIQLERWGQIEGTSYIGREPAPDEVVTLSFGTQPRHAAFVLYDHRADTKTGGRFIFRRVVPGWLTIGRDERMSNLAGNSTHRRPIYVRPGETLEVTLGNAGRPVVGRFVLPPDSNRPAGLMWRSCTLETARPRVPEPEGFDRMSGPEKGQWYRQWSKTPPGRAYFEAAYHDPSQRTYRFLPNEDNAFRIEEVIPGRYRFVVYLGESAWPGPGVKLVGPYFATIEVPEMAQAYTDEPLDLGTITLVEDSSLDSPQVSDGNDEGGGHVPLGRYALSFDGVDDCLIVPARASLALKPSFFIEVWAKPDLSALPRQTGGRLADDEPFPEMSLLRQGGEFRGESAPPVAADAGDANGLDADGWPPISPPRDHFGLNRIQSGGFMGFLLGRSGSFLAVQEDGRIRQTNIFRSNQSSADRPGWSHFYVYQDDWQREYVPAEGPLVVGRIVPKGFPFKGQIAEIRLWNMMLPIKDTPYWGSTLVSGDEPNLVACWSFDEGGGQMVRDISRNGNHAWLGTSPEADDADPRWVSLDTGQSLTMTSATEYVRRHLEDWKTTARNNYLLRDYEILDEYVLEGSTGAVAYVWVRNTLIASGGIDTKPHEGVIFLYRLNTDRWEGIFNFDGALGQARNPDRVDRLLATYRQEWCPQYLARIEQGYISAGGQRRPDWPVDRIPVQAAEGDANRQVALRLADERGPAGTQTEAVSRSKPSEQPDDVLKRLIDEAMPGTVITIPKGRYTAPVEITKPVVLRGESQEGCIIEVTADRPAVLVNTGGKGTVTVENLTIQWQLATSGRVEQPFALAVKDTNAVIRNCRFVPLGDYRRSPVAVRIDGFSKATVDNCRFNGFEYVICYGEGTEGTVQDCVITDCGHQGVINYTRATLTVQRCLIIRSKFHAVRCTGGTLHVKDNLLIENANRGIYLGNKTSQGTVTNNLILGNGVGISGFARAEYAITNNVIVDNKYTGINMRDSCRLSIRDNVLAGNRGGIALYKEGAENYNVIAGNTYWSNTANFENLERPAGSLTADPQFADPNHGDFSVRGPAQKAGHGLTNPQIIRELWKKYEQLQHERPAEPATRADSVPSPTQVQVPTPAPSRTQSPAVLAWQRTDLYVPPDPDGFFPDDREGGRRLDALFQAVDKDKRSDEEILSTVRQGLRRTTQHRTLILAWIGNRYIWGKEPQNPQAIEIMYHAVPLERHYAIYFGLSVVKNKSPNLLRTLADICMQGEEIGRITWSIGSQRDEMLSYITPYLQDRDAGKREIAGLLVKHFRGELDFEKWQRERRLEQIKVEFQGQLPQLRETLLTGDSKARREALRTIQRNGLGSILDDSFLAALEAAATDRDSEVRNDVARIAGGRWVWNAPAQDPNAIDLMLRLSRDGNREVYYNAVYFGLSTVRDKGEPVVRRLVEMALAEHENNLYDRIVWGLKGPMKATPESFVKILAQHLDRAKSDVHCAASVYLLYRDVLEQEPPGEWGLAHIKERYPEDLFAIPFSAREPFVPKDADALWTAFIEKLSEGVAGRRLPERVGRGSVVCNVGVRGREQADMIKESIESNPRLRLGESYPLPLSVQLFLEEKHGPAGSRPVGGLPESQPEVEGPAPAETIAAAAAPGPIQQRIDAAAPGATIRLEPGVYRERLVINKPLTLEGAGWDKTVVMTEKENFGSLEEMQRIMMQRVAQARSDAEREQIAAQVKKEFVEKMSPLMLSVEDTQGVVVRGIKFSSPGGRVKGVSVSLPIVKFDHSRARMADCAVLAGPGNGIHIQDGSDVEIDRTLVAAVWGTGLGVTSGTESSRAHIHDSDIRNCHYAGIRIAGRSAEAVIERCRISGAAWHGVRYDNVSPTLRNNLIFGNARSGIYASGQTAATVEGNLLYDNEMTGMSCWFQNQDVIEGNTFAANERSGLEVLGASKPVVVKNIFYDNPTAVHLGDISGSSPFAQSDGQIALEDNLFWANEHNLQSWRNADANRIIPLDEKAGVVADPQFADPSAKDFSLPADSPARQKGIGAAGLIPFESPWPLQPEELAIIPNANHARLGASVQTDAADPAWVDLRAAQDMPAEVSGRVPDASGSPAAAAQVAPGRDDQGVILRVPRALPVNLPGMTGESAAGTDGFLRAYEANGFEFEAGFMPDKTEYVWGEPMHYFTYVVRNTGDRPFAFMEGGDYRGGRSESHQITAVDAGGRPVSRPEMPVMGGLLSARELRPGEVYTKSMPVDRRLTFSGPGVYQVTGRRSLRLHATVQAAMRQVPVFLPAMPGAMPEEAGPLGVLTENSFRLTIHPHSPERMTRLAIEVAAEIAGYGDLAPKAAEFTEPGGLTQANRLYLALETLVSIREAEALDQLIRLARQGPENLRIAAVQYLGRRAEPRAMTAIMDALDDPEVALRAAAADALGTLGTREAVDVLLSRFGRGEPGMAAPLLKAMGRTRSPRVLDLLSQALAADAAVVRNAAVDGLVAFGSEQAVEILKTCVADPDMEFRERVVQHLAESLRQPIDARWLVPVVQSRKDADGIGDVPRLMRLYAGERGVPALLSCLDFGNPSIRSYYNYTIIDQQSAFQGGLQIPWISDLNRDGSAEELGHNRWVLRAIRTWVDHYYAYRLDEETLSPAQYWSEQRKCWGESIDGIGIRIRCDQRVWPEGMPQVIKIDVRDAETEGSINLTESPKVLQVELNGRLYERRPVIREPTAGINEGHGRSLHEFVLDDRWQRLTDDQPLRLTPGRYTLTVRLSTVPEARRTGLAPSRPVRFEVIAVE